MNTALKVIQLISAALLIASVLLQQRGSGLGATFGGGGETYQTRRGIEKFLFIITIVTGSIFLAAGLAQIIW